MPWGSTPRAAGSKSSSFRAAAGLVRRCGGASAMRPIVALCPGAVLPVWREPVRKDRSERKGGFRVMSGAVAILAFHQVYQPLGGSILLSAIVASLGFEPISAAVLALLANTAPVAFGSIGIPIVTLGLLTAPIIGHGAADQTPVTLALSAMVGRQLPIFSIIIPAFLIVVLAGWKRMVEVLPAVLTAGLVFSVVQFLVSNFIGPELTDVLAALVSMAAVALLLRVWKPRALWGFAADRLAVPAGATARLRSVGAAVAQAVDPPGRIVRAYMMYVILVVVILIGQMGNLPFFSGSPPGNVKNALHTPANITADLKCGQPAYALCPKPWIGPSPATDAGAFKFPFWRFQWPGSYSGTSAKP